MPQVTRLAFIAAMLLAAVFANLPAPAMAGDNDPLFVNMTSDDAHRAKMAIGFAKKQQERKHPVTIFLNDKGVFVGVKSKNAAYTEHQTMLATIIKDGGNVIVCPMCMEHYRVKKEDLIEGAQIGNPELTGSLLFKDNGKTLTW